MRLAVTVVLKAFEHVHPGAAGLPSPGLDHGLGEPVYPDMAAVEHTARELPYRRTRRIPGSAWRAGVTPRRHTPAEQATVDSRSRRSANTRGVTVGSIRTVTTRDSHRHRVPSPCAEYYRALALAGQRAALGFRAAPAT